MISAHRAVKFVVSSICFTAQQISLPNSDVTKQSQESIMNDFLMIDFMQADIIEILLNKVKALCVQE